MSGSPGGGYDRYEPWLLLAATGGLCVVTLSGQGSYKPFVYLTELLVLIRLGRWLWHDRRVSPEVIWLSLAPVAFLVCDVVAPGGISDEHAAQNLVAFLAVAAAVRVLPSAWKRGQWVHFGIVVVLAVIASAHAATVWLFLEPRGAIDNPRLLSHNPHFISLQAAAIGPVMLHDLIRGRGSRLVASVGLAAAVTTLALLSSIVGLVSVAAAGAAVAVVHLRRWLRTTSMTLAGAVLLAVLTYPIVPDLYAGPLDRARVELGADRLDERFAIWAEAWQLQRGSSVGEWVLGHGLGGFEADFPRVWVFPHHFALEVLYNSGGVGLLALFAAVMALAAAIGRQAGRGRGDVVLALGLMMSVGVFTFLTLPLTARVTTHALGLAVGVSLWVLKGGERGA